MKTKSTVKLTVLVLLALSTFSLQLSTCFAQGTAFTYQGRLNSAGSPVNGTYDFRFRLYQDPLGDTQAGDTLLTNGVPIANGLFLVTLDFGAGIFTGSKYWLEVDVCTNNAGSYTDLNPLQEVTPAPYAVFAGTASNLSGTLPAGQINGTLGSANLSGTYDHAVTFTNAGNSFSGSFTGNGGGLTGVNATTLNGLGLGNLWQTRGNAGTTPGVNYLGTTDNQPLEFHVKGLRALRLEPGPATNGAPNVIGGASVNYVSNSVYGATISGGGQAASGNSVTANFGTVGGGAGNLASGWASTVGGGADNLASSPDGSATVGGGYFNAASGDSSTVVGGFNNAASGEYAVVAGGGGNTASGAYSFAAGTLATAANNGSFVWSDDSGGSFFSTTSNQFAVSAAGGVVLAADVAMLGGANSYHNFSLSGGNALGYLYGSYPALGDGIHLGYNYYYDNSGNGHVSNTGGATSRLTTGYGFVGIYIGAVNGAPMTQRLLADSTGVTVNGTFNNSSDRNLKQDFADISPAQILEKVGQLPITEWSYKEDPRTRHVGPVAQDFYSTFNIGTDNKHIAPIDEGGVALAAIKGLNQKLEKENAELNARLEKLEQLINARIGSGK